VFCKPTHLFCSDASEFGLGEGYNLISGNVWHFELPVHLRLRTTLHALEFLACVITIWVDILYQNIPTESCILSQMDSSSAAGGLRKSNFFDGDDEIVQMTTAQHLALLVLQADFCIYSQWFAGDENIVADSLSHDLHFPHDILKNSVKSSIPSQVTFSLKISVLQPEIVSWLTCLLQNLASKTVR
jgi:hypothetical protein